MKVITNIIKYEAFDGTKFDSEKQCLNYEKEINLIKEIEKPLGKRINLESNQIIKHNKFIVRSVWTNLVQNVFRSKYSHLEKHIDHALKHPELGPQFCYVCREADGDLCWKLISRLMSIDFKTGIEYQQPYFALHPEEVKNPKEI